MTWSDYFTIPRLSFSALKHMNESPLHYQCARENPPADTDSLVLGRYVHTAILQPDLLSVDYAVFDGRRSGKAWTAFQRENAGKTILRRSDLNEAEDMIRSVRAHPEVRRLLSDPSAEIERPIFWTDAATGIACKGRPDYVSRPARVIMDLKTSRSIDARRFGHDIARYLYHAQLAWYADGIDASEGWAPERFLLVAVEKSAPYDVAVFELSEDAITVGRELAQSLILRLKECMDADHWPGRYPERFRLDASNLPPWMFGGGIPEIAFIEDAP